jgi:hypothetical protein
VGIDGLVGLGEAFFGANAAVALHVPAPVAVGEAPRHPLRIGEDQAGMAAMIQQHHDTRLLRRDGKGDARTASGQQQRRRQAEDGEHHDQA